MLRISIGASLLAITLSFDAFATKLEDVDRPGTLTIPYTPQNPKFDDSSLSDAQLIEKIMRLQQSPNGKLETPSRLPVQADQNSVDPEFLKEFFRNLPDDPSQFTPSDFDKGKAGAQYEPESYQGKKGEAFSTKGRPNLPLDLDARMKILMMQAGVHYLENDIAKLSLAELEAFRADLEAQARKHHGKTWEVDSELVARLATIVDAENHPKPSKSSDQSKKITEDYPYFGPLDFSRNSFTKKTTH